MSALGWIILILVIAAALIALAAWFYDRATNEVALVRTGAGGRRVAARLAAPVLLLARIRVDGDAGRRRCAW